MWIFMTKHDAVSKEMCKYLKGKIIQEEITALVRANTIRNVFLINITLLKTQYLILTIQSLMIQYITSLGYDISLVAYHKHALYNRVYF